MKNICLYFNLHQPNRLKRYTFFDIGNDHFYEDDKLNKEFLEKISEQCYLPMNAIMLETMKKLGKKFKICLSLSGTLIEQMEAHRPDVLESFKELANTGQVEFIGQTYYHSLSYIYSPSEFVRQVKKYIDKVKEHFGKRPLVFRNTGMIYSNDLAARLEKLGFKGVMAEGLDIFLKGRSYNYVYQAPNVEKIKTLLKNYKLSADITHHFNDPAWNEYPLTAEKFAHWVSREPGDFVNLFMPYETFGQHIDKSTGIFDFIKKLPEALVEKGNTFKTATELVNKMEVKDIYDIHVPISWRDSEKDLSAWTRNNMQQEALQKLYSLESTVINSNDPDLIHVWSKLQTSDHFYYMSTKAFEDGATRDYLSPYSSPYDGYIYFMNALSDLEISCKQRVAV